MKRKLGNDERTLRRATFDEVAELYARARPRCPESVVDDVVELGGFVLEVQDDYRVAGMAADDAPCAPEDVGDLAAEIEASALFGPVTVRRRLWDVLATADDHVALLGTASDHLRLPEAQRERLLAGIRRRIEARPGGTVRKSLLAVIQVARRR